MFEALRITLQGHPHAIHDNTCVSPCRRSLFNLQYLGNKYSRRHCSCHSSDTNRHCPSTAFASDGRKDELSAYSDILAISVSLTKYSTLQLICIPWIVNNARGSCVPPWLQFRAVHNVWGANSANKTGKKLARQIPVTRNAITPRCYP